MTYLQDLKQTAVELIFLYKMKFRFSIERKMADLKHQITSKRYLVVPDLRVASGMMNICADQIQTRKKQGRIKKNDGYLEISQKAFYITPLQRGGPISTPAERAEMTKRFDRYANMAKKINPMGKAPKGKNVPPLLRKGGKK